MRFGTPGFLFALARHGYLVWYSKPIDGKAIGGEVVRVTALSLAHRRTLQFSLFKNRLFLLLEFIVQGQYLRELRQCGAALRARGAANGGLCVVDIGANAGLFSLLLDGWLGKRVPVTYVGFEPFSENNALCADNWRRNGLRFVLRQEALSDRAEDGVTLHLLSTTGATISPEEVASYLAARGPRASIPTERVPVTTLDGVFPSLNIPRVDVIKLDIEGAEEPALRGAAATIARFRPFIVCSYEHGQNDKARIAAQVSGYGEYGVVDNTERRTLTFVPREKQGRA